MRGQKNSKFNTDYWRSIHNDSRSSINDVYIYITLTCDTKGVSWMWRRAVQKKITEVLEELACSTL
jgi:hypothetical protein